ncbi:hypothetical protein, partial [Pseudomonas amygdali]|uniref:hypothetical protein n=1 Tax=Pseudomonas amygdali TaxID=47877 RepID=UPI001EE4CFDA
MLVIRAYQKNPISDRWCELYRKTAFDNIRKRKNIDKKQRCQRSEPNGHGVDTSPHSRFIPGFYGCYQKAISVAGGVNQGMFTLLGLKWQCAFHAI